MKKRLIALLILIVAAMFVAAAKKGLIFQTPKKSVKAAHAIHEKAGMKCVDCHIDAKTSAQSKDRLIPAMKTCASCHPEAVSEEAPINPGCFKCHIDNKKGYFNKGEYPVHPVLFSHKAHSSQSCSSCHEGGTNKWDMKTCYSCHTKQSERLSTCRVCHLSHKDGRMVSEYSGRSLTPPEWLKGPTHGVGWVAGHARLAGADSSFCASCHRETFCTDCHAGRKRPRDVHPGNWMRTHGSASRMQETNCMSCHRTQTSCLQCHRRTGVAPDSPSKVRSARHGSFHGNQSPAQICSRARRDIMSCASCHSENSCIKCHGRINPHPPGFKKDCSRLARANRSACAKCHRGNVQNLCQ